MEPLALRIRPKSLETFSGQKDLVGEGKPLKIAIEKQHLFSFILWGPPGTGKTTLARIYANALSAELFELSAVSAGKDDIKHVLRQETDNPKILFLDEIHRFTKSQQDFLLPYVESGELTLIGATTENPSFEVIPALLSRCRVFVLTELSQEELEAVARRTEMRLSKEALKWLTEFSNGDARKMLTHLESTASLYGNVTPETLADTLQSPNLRYDKKGEEHYDTVSAFIKSMRASQADAALYYLARMTEAGEDPLFIARRMVIFASEDIGIAQPTALVVANAVFNACHSIGYPECAINLAHGVTYLAQAKKSRVSYDALKAAQLDVKKHKNLPIPLHLRNAPTKLMKDIGYGKGYTKYGQESYLPEKLKDTRYLEEE